MRAMEKKIGFELLPHTADITVRSVGRSLEEAFAYAVIGLFGVMTNVESIEPREKREVTAEGFDLENLLYNFLEKILFLFDTEQFLVSRVDNIAIEPQPDGYMVKATVSGERFDPERHESRVLVKAITYHGMRIYQEGGLYVVEYTPDI
jgi:Uncharacterized conserved protein